MLGGFKGTDGAQSQRDLTRPGFQKTHQGDRQPPALPAHPLAPVRRQASCPGPPDPPLLVSGDPPPTRKIRWALGYVTHRRRPRLRDRAAAEVKWKPPILLKRGDVFPHTALLPVSCVPLPSASRGGVTNDRATCRPGPSSGGAGQLPRRTRLLMSLPLSPFSEDELLFCSPSPRPSLNPAELRPDVQIRQRTGAVTSPVPVRGAKALRP